MNSEKGADVAENTFHNDLALLQESFLLERILGIREISEEKARKRMQILDLNFPGPYYCTVIFAPYLMEKKAEEIDLLLSQIAKLVQTEYRAKGFSCYTVTDSYCNAISILSLSSVDQFDRIDKSTRELAAHIMRLCKVKIFVGIGLCVEQFIDISRSANSAAMALSFKYSFAQNNVIQAKDVKRFYTNGALPLKQYYDRILGCFYDGNLMLMNKRLQDLHGIVKQTSNDELNSMRNICIELSASILRQASEIGINYSSDGLYTRIAQTPTVNELLQNFLTLSGDLLHHIQALKTTKSHQLVQMAESYIETHLLDDDLTVRHICEYIELSQPYFSNIFFKETGQHINDYINSRRIEQAKNLLVSSNSKVIQISRQLGFSHPSYFNNLFKRYTGYTPQKYREIAR